MNQAHAMVLISLSLSLILLLSLIIYKYFFHKNISLFILLIIISFLPVWSIFRGGTYQSGDLTLHTVYLQSFYENLKDGILMPQWAGGLCSGYGCPIFMFEYVMPFYIGSIFHFLGFSFLLSMKLFLAFSYVLSGIAMYIFLKNHLNKISAFVGSLLYLFAPVRFIEMHFRVSVGTDASFIFIPLAFYFAEKSLGKKPIFVALGAINLLFLILSHSSAASTIIPFAFLYVILICKDRKTLIYPIISFLLGACLSAYYILPAIVYIRNTWYIFFQKVDEFYPLLFYLISPARFGLLFQGNHGELRFIVGYVQEFIFAAGLYYLIINAIEKKNKIIAFFLIISSALCFTLLLPFTKPLWNSIFFLRTYILPWRMLVPISFLLAFLGAIVVKNWKHSSIAVFSFIIVFSTTLNWGNRNMAQFPADAYARQFTLYTEYIESPTNTLYLKRFKDEIGKLVSDQNYIQGRRTANMTFLTGKGTITQLQRTQINHEYLLNIHENSTLSENTFYFPGWKMFINGRERNFNITDQRSFNTFVFSLPKGKYLIKIQFTDTPIVHFGKILSFLCFILIMLIIFLSLFKLSYKLLLKNNKSEDY
jgi:hypothetical protein